MSTPWQAIRARNDARCERLVARSALVGTSDIRWEDAPAVEIDDEAVTVLAYMRDVEGFTIRDLVGLAGHPTTLRDPLIRRFLVGWRAEEQEHARVLDRFLSVYCAARGRPFPEAQPAPPSRASLSERLTVLATRPIGHVVAAAHMAWGAINEMLALSGYRLLAHRCGNPVLDKLLTRIAAQESRHYSFYTLQAEWRLAKSPLARTLLPAMLRRKWTPVGVGGDYKQPEEFDQVLAYLAGGDGGTRAVSAMDRTLGRLPGFGELHLYATTTQRSLARVAGLTMAAGPAPTTAG